ncbi:MAG: hypothetical protein ACE5D0_06160 [Fidelibacterota bacterium]
MTAHLLNILLYTLFGFATLYPFFLWLTPRKKIGAGFYNFNLGLSCVIGGMAFVLSWIKGADSIIVFGITGWLGLHLVVTYMYWNREKISNGIISFSSLIGCIIFAFLTLSVLPVKSSIFIIPIGILSQSIVAGVLFAMILGHWYLNVIQLPIGLLQKASNGLAGLLVVRLLWNLVQLPSIQLKNNYGVSISTIQYIQTLDGFFLGVALLFGLIVPLILHFFIWKTLKLHATQSATGLLYISVLSVFVGDLCYKFVLFQDGLVL